MSTDKITIYTDGAARGNPGPGGYGAVLLFGKHRKELSQGYRRTTNNRMELLAVIVALESIKDPKYPVHIYTDSKYVCDAIDKGWLDSWIKVNFKKKKNPDLWKRFVAVRGNFNLHMHWVKGHAGNVENERCDQLATEAADYGDLLIDEGYEAQN